MKNDIHGLLGINKELSTYDVPVFEKNLGDGLWGAANNDRTIHINKKLNKKQHIKQFRNGTVRYDSKNIYYKPNLSSPMQVIPREKIIEGNHGLPWEKSIYKKTKTYAK
jgi:hypothetical protein